MTGSPLCIWAQVSEDNPWQNWWPELVNFFKWPNNLIIERWPASDLNWSRVLDSLNSFTLFKQNKVLVILDADKALKSEKKELNQLIEKLCKGPHRVILQSTQSLPTALSITEWKSVTESELEKDDKAGFRWIDSIHLNQLTQAMADLDAALGAGSHPLQLLQLLNRDLRLGRLIHYAFENRLKEHEISTALRLPNFAVRKWLKRDRLSKTQWSAAFDRMLEGDLEMKSGADEVWALRKLTFDLVKITHAPSRDLAKEMKLKAEARKVKSGLLQPSQQLWTVEPSYA